MVVLLIIIAGFSVMGLLNFAVSIKYQVEPDINAAEICYNFMYYVSIILVALFALCITLVMLLWKQVKLMKIILQRFLD